jgi:uncharacterized protein (TIGR03086 family)
MDAADALTRATGVWLDRVREVKPDQWASPTPCQKWDVRALVNHVVAEQRWIPPLVAGSTIAEVGDRFDGDVLGADPLAVAEEAAAESVHAAPDPVAEGRIVHLSFGDVPAAEYAWGIAADLLIHGWDLAAATGSDRGLDPALTGAVAQWFAAMEDAYRAGEQIAPRPGIPAADPQSRLLVSFGRDPGWVPAGEG